MMPMVETLRDLWPSEPLTLSLRGCRSMRR